MKADLPYGEALAHQFPERVFRFYPEVGSTNKAAWEMAEGGAPHGTLIVADAQTAGRGRLEREWHSPPGLNLYFSLVLRPPIPLAVAPLLGLAASLAVARCVGLQVKWPNDVIDGDGKKVAGILSEVHANGADVEFVVLGIGMNVNQIDFPIDLPNAMSLKKVRKVTIERVGMLRALMSSLESWLPVVWNEPDRMLETWRKYSATLGRVVQVEGLVGRAVDLRHDGALLLETDSGQIVPVLSGDVVVEKP